MAQSGRFFRGLSAQYLAALAVCAAFFVGIFVAGYTLVHGFTEDSAEITLASYRVVRSMHLLHLLREFVLDQSLFPAVTPQLRERIAGDVGRLRREHGLLVRGGNAKSYAPLAELTFRATCLRARPADCLAPSDINYPAVSNGLDALVTFFLDQAELLLADADADKRAGLPSAAHGPADGPANTRFKTLWALGRNEVLEGLSAAVEMYEEAARQVVQTVVPMHGTLMGATLAALALMFVFLFRPMMRNLKAETRRTRRMLMLVPEDVADKMEAIQEYLRGGSDEVAEDP